MYKFIDTSHIEKYTGQPIVIGETRYSNVVDENIILSAGYKPMAVETEPSYDVETQMLVAVYTDGNIITQSWTVTDIPPVPVQPPTLEERIDACEYMLIDMLNFM